MLETPVSVSEAPVHESPTKSHFDFNPIYEKASDYYGFQPSAQLPALLKKTNLQRGHVLDLGSGQGRDALIIARQRFSITALDISQVAMHQLQATANEQNLPIQCTAIDVTTYDYPERTFDFAMACTLLDHLTVDDGQRVAAGMARTLVHGGFGYAMVFTTEDPGYHKRFLGTNADMVSETADAIEHYFAQGELCTLFEQVGMKIIDYNEMTFLDRSHGPEHMHGIAYILFRKP